MSKKNPKAKKRVKKSDKIEILKLIVVAINLLIAVLNLITKLI